MVIHGALTDSKVGGNVLARMSGHDEVHDLALARRQPRDKRESQLSRSRGSASIELERARNARKQLHVTDRLLNKVGGTRFHRLDG